MIDERREYQRLHLVRPLDGWFGDYAVQLTDVSATGARVESTEEIPDAARALLRFYWRDTEVEILAETVRRADSSSGLAFLDHSELLRSLIAQSATEVLRAQEANASGDRDRNVVGDETLTAALAGARGIPGTFIVCTYGADGRWKRRNALLPDQPEKGFAVSSAELPEQIELLCRMYAEGDDEARRMVRLLAELSVSAK